MLRTTKDAGETRALGEAVGRRCAPDTWIALVGDLGAGKTAFTQGLARGLGVTAAVVSPTFVVVAVHENGRLPLVHVDLYRVERAEELEQLGLDELTRGAVSVVEWADLHPGLLPSDHVRVELCEVGAGREIRLVGLGPRSRALVEAVDG